MQDITSTGVLQQRWLKTKHKQPPQQEGAI